MVAFQSYLLLTMVNIITTILYFGHLEYFIPLHGVTEIAGAFLQHYALNGLGGEGNTVEAFNDL